MSSVDHSLRRRENARQDANEASRLLIVDDEAIIREILVRKLSRLGYVCDQCSNGVVALEQLDRAGYDLLVTDIAMPEMGGIELMKEARSRWPNLAVILVTSVQDLEVAVDALKEGAFDYITKPFSLEQVAISVTQALERRRLLLENISYRRDLELKVHSRQHDLRKALDVLHANYHSTLVALGTALDSRHSGNEGHSLRVTLYALRLARQMGMDETQTREIEQGALLHDIGKIGIPDSILRKEGELTPPEQVLLHKHPEIGYRILSGIKFLKGAARLVLHHEERFDGSGYPAGLRGDEISVGGRVFAVADCLNSRTSDCLFQDPAAFDGVRDQIARMSGSKLDPFVVGRFLRIPREEWEAIRREAQGHVRKIRFTATA